MDKINYLCGFIGTFSLTNIVSYKTCFKTLNGTLFDNFAFAYKEI